MAAERLGARFKKLNDKLTDLLEENRGLKQQYRTLQEENQETFRINSELKEQLQEKDKQLEKQQQHILNLEKQKSEEKQKLKEIQKLKQQYKALQEENQVTLRINSELKEKLLNLESQENEIQQLDEISQKFLEILDLDDINDDDIKILKEKNKSLIDEQQNCNMPDKSTTFPLNDNDDNVQFDIENSSNPSWKPIYKSLGESSEKTGIDDSMRDDIRVVVGLDFGTTYSGFAYCHTSNNYICTYDQWNELVGQLKTNTVLHYDDKYNNVKSWGAQALANKRDHKKKQNNSKNNEPVELFKLHLGNLQENLKPKLPVDYKKAIADYLREIGELIKQTITSRWQNINFFKQVLLVLPVPAEYSGRDKSIIRECAFYAGLIEDRYSQRLQFTTEPEAAAIYCMKNELWQHDLLSEGTTFMIVDCGGGTVDLTTRKLVENNQLSEITERIGDFCGSTFIDKEFIKFLRGKLGTDAIDNFEEDHYEQLQYIVQLFCMKVKILFSGDDMEFKPFVLDIERNVPTLLQYVSGEFRDIMEENEWSIVIKYNDVKSMFDPIVDRIINMIHIQLSNNREICSAMFLVGGFSESRYLLKRIKQEFQHCVKTISVPRLPIVATVRGAVIYGSSLKNSSNWNKMNNQNFMISACTLKFTYGIKIRKYWTEKDPIHRKTHDGRIDKFDRLAKRGTQKNIDQEVTRSYKPLSSTQTKVVFSIYYTNRYNAEYCDEPGMKLLGNFNIILSGSGQHRILFGLNFGQMEITATAKNETNGQIFETKFEIDAE